MKVVDRPGRYGDGRGGFGLSLLVRPVKDGLGKNWQQRVQVKDKVRSLGLGSYPNVSLSTARNLAAKNVMKIRERYPPRTGIDRLLAEAALPAVTSASAGPTFADVAEESIKFRRDLMEARKQDRAADPLPVGSLCHPCPWECRD